MIINSRKILKNTKQKHKKKKRKEEEEEEEEESYLNVEFS